MAPGEEYSWEIVIVDDGSRDKSSSIVKSIKNKKIKLVKLRKNLGKGGALRKGFLKAKGEYIVFTDADLSVPIRYLDKLLKGLEKAHVAIGSRKIKGALLKKRQGVVRESMGKVFTLLTQIMIGSDIVDFTCGFKGFHKKSAKKVFRNSKISRWAYDAEIIFLCHKYGFGIEQIPVIWENREASRVKVGKAALESLRDLVKIRYYYVSGKYER